jgi:hypothetical protein
MAAHLEEQARLAEVDAKLLPPPSSAAPAPEETDTPVRGHRVTDATPGYRVAADTTAS